MKKLITLALLAAFLLTAANSASAQAPGVIGDEVEAYAGSGSSSDPFRYLFDSDSKVTWKHLSDLKEKGITEIYEKREENTFEGRLLYSWTFSGADITTPEGPYFLGINFYSGDSVSGLKGGSNSRYFSLACKRDLPGPAAVTMYVGDYYEEGTVLMLYYYGGYDSAVVHGSAPVTDRNEIRTEDRLKKLAEGLSVKKGYVEFILRHGGNYFLTEGPDEKTEQEENAAGSIKDPPKPEGIRKPDASGESSTLKPENSPAAAEKAAVSSIGKKKAEKAAAGGDKALENGKPVSRGSKADSDIALEAPGDNTSVFYTEEVSLGRINRLFHNENIAKAIADSISKDTSEEITQADLNSIKKLYIADCGLESLEDLSKAKFEGLESLIVSGNRLKVVPVLNMPKLQYIDISSNELEDAGNLAALKKLEVILLQNNKLSSIFDLSVFPGLVSINLSNNEIASIPRLSSTSLVYLNLSGNKLNTLSGLQEVPELEFIDLSGNQLKRLPDFEVCRHLNEIITGQDKRNSGRLKLNSAAVVIPAFILLCICLRYIIRRRKTSLLSL